MHKRTSSCSICVLAICLLAATELRAQDGQDHAGLSAADQAAPNGQPTATAAAGQPKAVENRPPDYSALPPAQDYSNADLAKRVSDLEKQLADYAKAAADEQVTSAEQALDCPQRPDSDGRRKLHPKRRQQRAVRQRPKYRGLSPRETRTVGRVRA